MTTLFPFQDDVVGKFNAAIEAGEKRILLVAPTGSGKTVMAAAVINDFAAQYKNVLFLAHRREINRQTSKKLDGHDVAHGVIQAELEDLLRPQARVQVASIQTLMARAVRTNRMELPPADLVVIDECHHAVASTYARIIGLYPDAILLGLTATPCRADGRGLGNTFATLIEAPQVPELIKLGYLVPTRVYAPVGDMDRLLKGVKVTAGDYNQKQLAARMDQEKLVGDIVTHWHKYGEGRKTVCFSTSVEHSVHIKDRFIETGVKAEHIDGGTPKDERDEALRRLAAGEIQVLTNCAVLTEGWDCPEVSCCILARPTRSFGLYRQMIGRVLRPAAGKENALILDHSGAVFRHGFVEDEVQWSLEVDRKAEAKEHTSAGHNYESSKRLIECSQCSAIRKAGEPCPHCGFMPKRQAQSFICVDGELGLVTDGRASARFYDTAEKRAWWAQLIHIGNERGYKANWASVNYKDKFGEYPGRYGATIEPEQPSPEVLAWVRHKMIRYAKRRAA